MFIEEHHLFTANLNMSFIYVKRSLYVKFKIKKVKALY